MVVGNSIVGNWLSGMDKAGAKWGSQSQAMWNEVQDNDRKAGLILATRPVEDYFASALKRGRMTSTRWRCAARPRASPTR